MFQKMGKKEGVQANCDTRIAACMNDALGRGQCAWQTCHGAQDIETNNGELVLDGLLFFITEVMA
jgi:hypothetical protein